MTVTPVLPLTAIAADACSSPLARAAIAAHSADSLARSLKALADPARLRIISIVSAHADQEACVCDLTDQLTLSQPTISHHLKVLVDAGFLTRAKRGTWSYYSLVPGSLSAVAEVLTSV
ncbi:metalloregulator ArsR/SmtB family transcription factor [Cryobacterium sp. PH31-O1]|uniref:ArsR/SmtB family transcription factor n=1 Tax=Cryobacterium sp. PH31-O1 TaxID=3046306 RepID=UPI0024B91E00|nr:metalloregulator ArsR/SmtB family transcription factor [Cryobacterium sp. PH31-O1]MDJ0338500.1 metalloregulator ArsR/SmtB family transcription factor [Cryobacterium sp. PH31-O1]